MKERIEEQQLDEESEDEPFLSPTFKRSIQVHSNNDSRIEEKIEAESNENNGNVNTATAETDNDSDNINKKMVFYDNPDDEENPKEIQEDKKLDDMSRSNENRSDAEEDNSMFKVEEEPKEIQEEKHLDVAVERPNINASEHEILVKTQQAVEFAEKHLENISDHVIQTAVTNRLHDLGINSNELADIDDDEESRRDRIKKQQNISRKIVRNQKGNHFQPRIDKSLEFEIEN